MTRTIDWKYQATLLVAVLSLIASIAIPFVAWKTDLQSKSIAVRVLSSISLQPDVPSVQDVQVSLGGQTITQAYVTTFEISNDGAKPIPAADFESHLTLELGSGVSAIRVQIAKRIPDNLPVNFDLKGSVVRMQPLLLNPNDSIQAVLITSGGRPRLQAHGRVAGVSSIRLEESLGVKSNEVPVSALPMALLFSLAGYIMIVVLILRPGLRSFRLLIISTLLVTASFSIMLNIIVWQNFSSNWITPSDIPTAILIILLLAFVAFMCTKLIKYIYDKSKEVERSRYL